MTDSAAQAQVKRTQMRCPACAFPVTLPAETCPRCAAGLRDAGPAPQTEINWRNRMVMGGVVLFFILGLAVFFFGWTGQGPARTTGPGTNRTGLSEALDTVNNLTEHADEGESSPMEARNQAAAPSDRR